jgi:DNA helicase TIP49 (TBP-interacting protein)
MAEPIHDKIKRSLQAAEGLYHRLVLLVGETGSGKTGVLQDVAEEFGSSVVNVNLALSGALMNKLVTNPSPLATIKGGQ